jgi:putative DNA primase/helicase
MIQIFRERPIVGKTGRTEKSWSYADLSVDSVPELFARIEEHLSVFPEEERYNLHYTLAHCKAGTREFEYQDVLAIDVDGIDTLRVKEYILPVLHFLKCKPEEVGVVSSGNGLHIIANIGRFEDINYFKQTRHLYKKLCKDIEVELRRMKLPFKEVDDGIWAASHTLRVPETDNIKTAATGYKKDSVTKCTVINRFITNTPISLYNLINMPEPKKGDELTNYDEIAKFVATDTIAVLSQCDFLKWCKDFQEDVSELNWYKMLSIVGRLDKGREIAHEMSCNHSKYTQEETDSKLEYVLAASKPKTCKNIHEDFAGCLNCPNWGKVNSPISLKGDDYIESKANGFYKIAKKESIDPLTGERSWKLTTGKPDYDGLLKYFDTLHSHRSTEALTYLWQGTHWKSVPSQVMTSFAEDNFDPKPSTSIVSEFVNKVDRTNIFSQEEMNNTISKKINLRNGVLDTSNPAKPVLTASHSKEYGFTYVLDYDYDPNAKCPTFDKYIDDVTMGREALKNILLEFYAYSMFAYPCTMGKALFLLGAGKNGKSVYTALLCKLVGMTQFGTVALHELGKDQMRALLLNKLVNVTEEATKDALTDSSYFKGLVTGGATTAKIVYKEPFIFYNTAKFIIQCNSLPNSYDTSYGQLRRMLILPFDARFDGPSEDLFILDKMVEERSGILNRVIEASVRLSEHGFTKTPIADEALNTFAMDNDSAYCFIKNFIDWSAGETSFVTFRIIYKTYVEYCEENKFKPVNSNDFAKKLQSTVPDLNSRKTLKGTYRERAYKRIRLLIGHSEGPNSDY